MDQQNPGGDGFVDLSQQYQQAMTRLSALIGGLHRKQQQLIDALEALNRADTPANADRLIKAIQDAERITITQAAK